VKRWLRIIDDLAGRSHRRVVNILLAQIDKALDGVEVAAMVTDGRVCARLGRERMSEIEHAGDAHRAELVQELVAALTTPVDREDLFRVSRSVDDVLDTLRDYVRETDLYGVRLGPLAGGALDDIAEGLRDLRRAVDRLIGRPGDVTEAALAAHKHAGAVRHRYGVELAALLGGDITGEVLKRRELLRRLDVVGLRLGECADALSDAMLKRSL
jgi:hypothetical protein